MGESSACLVRSFSQPSPTSSEEKKGNPLQRALTTSISFGRFMSESLDWEKWSAFTHNRYLEEVEKYSRPGSVAEKKAYFEAHFKRRRAAKLLEQQSAAASDFLQTNAQNNTEYNSSLNSQPISPIDQNASCDDASTERTVEDAWAGRAEKVIEPPVLLENPAELTNWLDKDERLGDIVSKKEDKDDSPARKSTSLGEKKPEVSSSKVLTTSNASKCAPSVKPITPPQLKSSDKTPESKNDERRESGNKRRCYITSLGMSINLGETQKCTSSGVPKIATNSRITRAPAKKYKNRTLPQTSTRAAVNGVFKNLAATSPVENRRTTTPNSNSVSASRTGDVKLQSASTSYSKSANTLGCKARLPTVASCFTFKSEERAAKRKEFIQKFEEKLKSNETEKQLHAKSQAKTRSNFMDLRNSFAFKATKNAEVSQSIELPKKKVPTVRYKVEERVAAFKLQDSDSRPPWRLSMKTDWSKDAATGKNSTRPPISSAKYPSKKIMNENTSPNIQL